MRGTPETYTDDELKRYLNEWVEEHGEAPVQRKFNADESTPCTKTYRTRFGGWEKAKEELID